MRPKAIALRTTNWPCPNGENDCRGAIAGSQAEMGHAKSFAGHR